MPFCGGKAPLPPMCILLLTTTSTAATVVICYSVSDVGQHAGAACDAERWKLRSARFSWRLWSDRSHHTCISSHGQFWFLPINLIHPYYLLCQLWQ